MCYKVSESNILIHFMFLFQNIVKMTCLILEEFKMAAKTNISHVIPIRTLFIMS